MINKLKSMLPNLIIEENVDMSSYSTFKLGGRARCLVKVSSTYELRMLLSILKESGIDYVFLGNGSNTIFRDGIYEGVVIKFKEDSEFDLIKLEDSKVTVGANVLLSKISKYLFDNSYSGFERLSGIPGTIGGACFMNAGAYEKSIKDVILSCHGVSAKDERDFDISEMDLSYRNSIFMKNGYIVTSATFKVEKGNKDDISKEMKKYFELRNTKQPIKYPSCGSTFKRPEGYFAGKLIEDCGLKGYKVGGVEVSTLHAGFIINSGSGTATDLLKLIDYVSDVVYEKYHVRLEPEIRII